MHQTILTRADRNKEVQKSEAAVYPLFFLVASAPGDGRIGNSFHLPSDRGLRHDGHRIRWPAIPYWTRPANRAASALPQGRRSQSCLRMVLLFGTGNAGEIVIRGESVLAATRAMRRRMRKPFQETGFEPATKG